MTDPFHNKRMRIANDYLDDGLDYFVQHSYLQHLTNYGSALEPKYRALDVLNLAIDLGTVQTPEQYAEEYFLRNHAAKSSLDFQRSIDETIQKFATIVPKTTAVPKNCNMGLQYVRRSILYKFGKELIWYNSKSPEKIDNEASSIMEALTDVICEYNAKEQSGFQFYCDIFSCDCGRHIGILVKCRR